MGADLKNWIKIEKRSEKYRKISERDPRRSGISFSLPHLRSECTRCCQAEICKMSDPKCKEGDHQAGATKGHCKESDIGGGGGGGGTSCEDQEKDGHCHHPPCHDH